MNIHKNARLTPHGRGRLVSLVRGGASRKAVAEQLGISVRTVAKWLRRFAAEGSEGLADRSSRPRRLRSPTPDSVRGRIIALRRRRRSGAHIAAETGVSPATVSRVLRRAGLSRISQLEPAEPIRRYERAHPGELIHLDIKKLGRFERVGHRITGDRTRQSNRRGTKAGGTGWEHVHVCVDDASRLAFTQIHPDEKASSAVPHLKAAVAWYARLGVKVERVMTDNGSCYKSFAFRDACKQLGLRHIRTKPYTPKTNGKAERFIQTALREWAYAKAYETSEQRKTALPEWTHMYNWHRPHAALNARPPISRLNEDRNNLLRLHI